MRAKFDWMNARSLLQGALSEDDVRLLDLLASGKSTPQIATILGEHRSRVWRRSQQLKQRLGGSGARGEQEKG